MKTIKSPFTGGLAILKRRTTKAKPFRGETFDIHEHYYQCTDTGNEFDTTEVAELNLQQVYNQYRAAHHIPFPDEIRRIREQYGLSAAKMSEVLDFGINSYRNYEKETDKQGEKAESESHQPVIPTPANAKLIRLAANPEYFKRFVLEKRDIFSVNAWKKITARIEELLNPDAITPLVDYIWNHHTEANEFTGYVRPSFEKVAQFVLLLAKEARPLKTRLNKLMFYCDFAHFQKTGFSISGCTYRAIQMGPVPSHYHELFGVLENEKYVHMEEELFDHGGIGERFLPNQAPAENTFSEGELATIQTIISAFADIRTREIIEICHQEKGWIDNWESRELISYQAYAFELEGV